MKEKTKRIIATIAAEHGITPEDVEHEMMEAIRAGMASPDPPHKRCGSKSVPMEKNLTWIPFFHLWQIGWI